MLDETTGLSERRATTVVTVILFVEALWVFLHKHLPLDAGLWSLQAELVQRHMSGFTGDGWRVIGFPTANIAGPLLSGLLSFVLSGEVVTRLLLSFGAIFLRGLGMLMLFRVLRVRDEAIYYLIPVLTLTALWFTGALPYLLAETVALWVLAFFISQDRPQGYAFWLVSVGLLVVALFHALVFLLAVTVVIMVMLEQRRSVHLSQGWLSSPRAVMSLLIPGAVVILLSLFTGEPIFRLSTSWLFPQPGIGRVLFLLTPAPNVLEATIKYGDVLHGILTLLFLAVLLGCFARAFLLAIEEVTWQSRAVRSAGYLLLILALLGPLIAGTGVETSSWLILAVVLILGGAYSRGPSARRTQLDRLLYLGAVITLVSTVLLNAFSVQVGSDAATSVLATSRNLVEQERQTAREDEHLDSLQIRFVLDSALAQSYASHLVATFSYSETAPIYLYGESDLLARPAAFQPQGGMVRTLPIANRAISPARPVDLGSVDLYTDPHRRVLIALPKGALVSPSMGPYELSLVEDAGQTISKGEALYRLAIGKIKAGRPIELAIR